MHLAGSRYIEKYFITIFIQVLRHVSNSPGTQGPCCFGFNGKCVKNVTYDFGDKVTRGKREFTISCIDRQQNQELIADCRWQNSGDLACDTAKGYTCQKQLDNIVSVITIDVSACAAYKEIEFDVIGEDTVQCTLPPKSEKPLDTDPQGIKKNPTQNANNRGQSTSNTRHGVKNVSQAIAPKEKANIFGTEEPEDGFGKGLGGGAIAAIVIVVLVTLTGITAAMVWKRRKIIGCIRKKVNKRPTKRTPDSPAESQNKTNEAERLFEISVTFGRGTYGDHQYELYQ